MQPLSLKSIVFASLAAFAVRPSVAAPLPSQDGVTYHPKEDIGCSFLPYCLFLQPDGPYMPVIPGHSSRR
ncbi:hypothetical protein PG993_008844 [Apiospora rasikravindrae]|uniref:Uncharacterized protein n=1 Tax=Apiospora rasikravindrae TaxID=990691 RepID=A0ABR1SR83_9PEZI